MCCFCCLATMLRVGLVDSVCHVLFLLSGDHASRRSCRQCMSCAVFAVWRPCFVWVLLTVYVIAVFAVWRPCFMRILSPVWNHALCGLLTVYVMSCFCYLVIMFVWELLTVYVMYYCCCHTYTNIAIWEPYFVQVVLAVYLMLLWPSGNHASCQHFVIYILLVLCQVLLLFVWS